MLSKDTPIQRKLMTAILLTSGTVLLLTWAAYFAYEVVTFRETLRQHVTSLADIVAANSTAALAFNMPEEAAEILAALEAEPFVEEAVLYDAAGERFARYAAVPGNAFPETPGPDGFRYEGGSLVGFASVTQGDARLGTLYIRGNVSRLWENLRLYSIIAALVLGISLLVAYLLSRVLQRQISSPILALTDIASAVSDRGDYAVRAVKQGDDEIGVLTTAFNQMLAQIQAQDQALRDSEERARLMVEGVRDYAVLMMDPEGYILHWNEGVERLHGYSAEEILGQHFSRFYPSTLIESGLAQRELDVASAEGRYEDEGWRVRKDGSRFWASVVVTALRDEDGRLRGFAKVTRDITERKEAEVALQAQLSRLDLLNSLTRAISERQTLRSVFQVVLQRLEDHLPVDFGCVYLHDAEHRGLTLSGVGPRSWPIAREIGLPNHVQVPSQPDPLARSLNGEMICAADLPTSESALLRRLSTYGLDAAVLVPMAVESHTFGVLLVARRALTTFSEADCEFLRQLSDHVALAAHQAQLHAALQQAFDDLRQTQQAVMQQERLRALGQMASGIAHDINNAISPVALYTESLLEGEEGLSPRARNYLETIQRAIEDVAATVARVREFYRKREETLVQSPVDLNTLVQHVLDLTRVRWSDMPQQRGVVIDVETDLDANLPAMMGVEGELREALTNLIFNAVDALPEGGTLMLRTQAVVASGHRYVEIAVSDTGVGMDEATRRRALEPFFTTKGDRGTGLGLAMVYGVVQRHGGSLDLDSIEGEGTTVRMRFPVAAPTDASPGSPDAVPAMPRLRLLVIDDDAVLLKSLRDALENEGHVVLTASNGARGIELFRAALDRGEPVSVVITDLGMPHMDGAEVARALKELSPLTPILLLTGWGQRLLDEGSIPLHVDQVLSKPPRLRQLREALAALSQHVAS